MKLFGKDKEDRAMEKKPSPEELTEEMVAKSISEKFEQYKDEALVLRIEKLRNMEDECGVQVYKGSIKEPRELDDRMDMVGEKYGGVLKANVRSRDKGFLIVRHYVREYPEKDDGMMPPITPIQPQSNGITGEGILSLMLQQSKEREDRERAREERERERDERRQAELQKEREERERMNQAVLKAMSEQSQKSHEATQNAIMEMNKMVLQMVMTRKEPDVLDLASKMKSLLGEKNGIGEFMQMFNLAKDVLSGKEPTGEKSPMEFIGDVLKKVVEGLSQQAAVKQQAGVGSPGGKPETEVKAMELKTNNNIEGFIAKHRGELLQAITTDILSEYEKGRGLVSVFVGDPDYVNVPLTMLRTELLALSPERVVEFIPGGKGREKHIKDILQQAIKVVEGEIQSVASEPKEPPVAEASDDKED